MAAETFLFFSQADMRKAIEFLSALFMVVRCEKAKKDFFFFSFFFCFSFRVHQRRKTTRIIFSLFRFLPCLGLFCYGRGTQDFGD